MGFTRIETLSLTDLFVQQIENMTAAAGKVDSKYMQEHFPNFLRTAAYPVNTVLKKALKMPELARDIMAHFGDGSRFGVHMQYRL